MPSSLSDLPPWITPILSWNLIQLITGLIATFTPARSALRPVAAAATAVLAYLLQRNIQIYYSGTRPSGPVVAMCWVNVLNAIDLLVLSRASYEAQVTYLKAKDEKKDRRSNKARQGNLIKKIIFALVLPYNLRRINTPWQISRVPRFDDKNPSYVPNRSSFLLQSAVKLAIAGAITHFLTLAPEDVNLSNALLQLDQSKTVLLPFRTYDVSSFLRQAGFTLSFGIVTRASIVGGYTAGALGAVLLGSDPAKWPPVAGSLSGAWSLEKLWGQSWHQTLRRPLTSNATFLSSTLGLAPGSKAAHWIRVLVAFLGSGLVHALMDIGFGVPWEKTGALWFYGLQVVGLIAESVLARLLTPLVDGLGFGTRLKRAIGYVWVAGFLLWSTPVWINPILVSLWKDGTNVMSPWLGGPSGWY